MKKIFTLAMVFAMALCANAENRRWDFTNWSSATANNLINGSDWSDIEKSTGTAPTELSENKCFWEVSAMGTSEGTTLTANGEVISELEGLLYTNTNSRSLAIALDYQNASTTDASFMNYHGASYLWLGSSSKDYFVIPNVKQGATITMGIESHKQTEARGVELHLGHGTSGTKLLDPSGNEVEVPITYTEQTWMVPYDAADATNDDGTYNIQITNTNGCHIYFIEVDEDVADVADATIAYIYDSQYSGYDQSSDVIRMNIVSEENYLFSNVKVVDIDVSGDGANVSSDSLKNFDIVVVSGAIAEGNAYAQTIKDAIAYVPMVNMNANLYATWGYGEAVTVNTGTVTVSDGYLTSDLFTPSDAATSDYVQADGTLEMFSETLTGVSIPEDSYFAGDDIVATADGVTAIHLHNISRNAYIYMPYSYENTGYNIENVIDLITNAIKVVYSTQREITQTAAPTFSESYKHLNTDVTMACATTGAKIYYTTDGTTPSEESTLYTGTINFTEAVTITAIAYGDGFTPSETSSLTVSLYETSAAPTFSLEQEDGLTTVTIINNEDGTSVYYNFTGSSDATASTVYSSPIEITHPTTIYAFSTETTGKMQSEVASQHVAVNGKEERLNELSHFDANASDWSMGESKTKYYTDGNKSGYYYYDVTWHVEELPDGNDTIIVDSKEPLWNLTSVDPGNGWVAKTYGQGMLWERITVSEDIDPNNTTSRYRAETAFDQGASDNSVTFGNVQKSDDVENDPYSCHLQSTEAFQGPFDIVTYVANGSSSNQPKGSLWVSTDTTSTDNWEFVDSVYFSKTQRYIKKTIASYEGTEKVFVKLQAEFSSMMIMDIYILNAGETTGISEVNTSDEATGEIVRTIVYSINGTQLDTPRKGINIIKEVYADGKVKTRKVVVK